MIDAFLQIKQKLTKAYATIAELEESIEKNAQNQFEKEKALALKVIERIDQIEGEGDHSDLSEFLHELLERIGVSRIPAPIDRSPEYAQVAERVRREGGESGEILKVTGGAFVKGEELIRPAKLIVVA